MSVKTATKVPHNKPDLIWDQEATTCSIIEFSFPLDININRKVNKKLENYGPLVRNLRIMYPEYKFQVPPNYLKMIEFNENEPK